MHANARFPGKASGLLIAALAIAQTPSAQSDNGNIVVDSAAEAAANAPATVRDVDDARTTTLVLDEWVNRTLDRTVARTNRPLTLSGSISTRYTYVQGKQAPSVFNGFNTPLVTLGFKGILFRDYQEARNLTYSLGFTSSNGAAPTIQDANIAYSFLSTVDLANPTLNLTIGQQKKPWGQEAQADAEAQPSISGSTYLSTFGISDVSARDLGLVVRADALPAVDYGYNYRAPLISVAAGFFNGAGANVSGDNNRDKEWTVRAVLAPPVGYYNLLRGLTLGVSYDKSEKNLIATGTVITKAADSITVKGTGKDSARTFRFATAAAKTSALADTIYGDRTRLGVDVSYIRTPVNLTIEGVYATQDSVYWDAASKGFLPYHRQSWGGSVTLFLNYGEQFLKGYREQARPDDWWPVTWQPFFRVDGYDPNTDIDGQNQAGLGAWQFVATVGGNLFFARTSKLQVNYRWKKTENKPANFHETLAQFTYGF